LTADWLMFSFRSKSEIKQTRENVLAAGMEAAWSFTVIYFVGTFPNSP
jgi:hypothetical protein